MRQITFDMGDVIAFFRRPGHDYTRCTCHDSGICSFCLDGVPMIYLGKDIEILDDGTIATSNLHVVLHPRLGVMMHHSGLMTRMTTIARISDAVG